MKPIILILLAAIIPLVVSKVCQARNDADHPVYQMKVGGRYRFEDGVFVWKTCYQIPDFIQNVDGVWYANPKNKDLGTHCLQYRLLKFPNPHLIDVQVVGNRVKASKESGFETPHAKFTQMKDITKESYNASLDITEIKAVAIRSGTVIVIPHNSGIRTIIKEVVLIENEKEAPPKAIHYSPKTSKPPNIKLAPTSETAGKTPKLYYSTASPETTMVKSTDSKAKTVTVTTHVAETSTLLPKLTVEREEKTAGAVIENSLFRLTIVVLILLVLCGFYLKMWFTIRRAY